MALSITARGSAEDPNDPLRQLAEPAGSPAGLAVPSPWVEPDYTTIARDENLAGPGPFRDWPGPPLVMPAGLLPDGQPFGPDDRANALRISGQVPDNDAQADAVVWAYRAQQDLLRGELDLPDPIRSAPHYELRDTPTTLAVITEIHRQERDRRRRLAG